MDDFEKAILFSFDQTGVVDGQLKDQAVAFCQQIKLSPGIHRLCLERFASSSYAEVQFWCLQALEEVVRDRYLALDPTERTFVRSGLMACICDPKAQLIKSRDAASPALLLDDRPPFVRNKLAQIVVMLMYLEYPSVWPSVFLDLMSALKYGPTVVDMFCRILATLDEEVVSLDYPRSQEELAAATRIKDAMREQCIRQVVEALYSLVVAYESRDSGLAANILATMQPLISWVDINLVAHEQFLGLLFRFLASDSEPVRLRAAACDCLLAIVSKRMDARAKLALVQRLQIVQVCHRLSGITDHDLELKVSGLLTGLASELLDCGKKLEGNTEITAAELQAAAAALNGMLEDVLPAVLYFMDHGNEDISSTTFQFLLAYVARVKQGGQLSPTQGEHLQQMLGLIRSKMRYEDSALDDLDEGNANGLEEEERMEGFRRNLNTLLKNIAKVAPDVTRSFVQASLLAAVSNATATAADIEVAVSLVYQLGEGISEETLKPGSGILAETVASIISSTIPHHRHRLVALEYLETVVRYVRFVQQHQEYIPSVLGVFLDGRGLHHPHALVHSRASYLFMRICKALRSQLRQYVDTILQSLQDTFSAITGPPQGLKAEPGGTDDRLYVFEAVGFLIGLEDVPPQQQKEYLSILVRPLCEQAEEVMAKGLPAGDMVGPTAAVYILQQVMQAIAALSKGFGELLANGGRPESCALFEQTVEMVLRILRRLPRNKALRGKVISFVHRMIECLGTNIFPLLPPAIEQLLVDCEAPDMMDFIQLVNQLMNKFKGAMTAMMIEVVGPIVSRVFAMLPEAGLPLGPGTNTEEVRELRDLQRSYLLFLQTITVNNLTSIFLAPQNQQCLTKVIASLLETACTHSDVTVRKTCVQTFSKFIKDWCGGGNSGEGEKVVGFRRFVIERFATEGCLLSLVLSNLDLQDANTVAFLGEIVAAQKVIYDKCGDEFLIHFATVALPAVSCPANVGEQYCAHIRHSDAKDTRTFLRTLLGRLRPCNNGSSICR